MYGWAEYGGSKIAQLHTQGQTYESSVKYFPLLTVRVEISLLYNIPVVFLLTVPDPSSMPPTKFTQHFHWGICDLFTKGNWCISCYASPANYVTCQRDLQVNIQQFY